MNYLMFLMWFPPLILIHECGHAIIGKLCGLKIHSISIGQGRQLLTLHLFGVIFRINRFLWSGGFTVGLPQNDSLIRLKMWLYILGGIVTHILLILLSVVVAGEAAFDPQFWTGDLISTYAPLQTFVYVNLLFLLSSIIPRSAGLSSVVAKTDGYHLLTIPFMKNDNLEQFKVGLLDFEAQDFIHEGKADEAIAFYRMALTKEPDNFLLKHNYAVSLALKGEYETARQMFIKFLEAPEVPAVYKNDEKMFQMLMKNNIASQNAALNRPELAEEALKYSAEALRLAPHFAHSKGTCGSVLIRYGNVNRGIELLKEAFRLHSHPAPRAGVASDIAIGEAKLGNRTAAMKWLAKAREICPNLHYVTTSEQEITSLFNEKMAVDKDNFLRKTQSEATANPAI